MGKLVSIAELPILVVAGIVGQKVAAALWKRALGDDPPDTAQERPRWGLLIPAAVIEGTFYKLFRMALDRAIRTGIARSSGTWVGQAGEGE